MGKDPRTTSISQGPGVGETISITPRTRANPGSTPLLGASQGQREGAAPEGGAGGFPQHLHARRLVLLHQEPAGAVEAELAVRVGTVVEVGPHRRRHRQARSCERKQRGKWRFGGISRASATQAPPRERGQLWFRADVFYLFGGCRVGRGRAATSQPGPPIGAQTGPT